MPSRKPVLWSAFVALLVLSSKVFLFDLIDRFWIFAAVAQWFVWGLAAVLSAPVVWLLLRKAEKKSYALGLALIGLACAVAVLFSEALAENGRFSLLRPYYEVQRMRAEAGTLTPDYGRIELDRGLIGFHVMNGIPDGWIGVIYDPDDALRLNQPADRFDDTMHCYRRLAAHWYSCGVD